MATKVAIVAVQTNLIGKMATPAYDPEGPAGHTWPTALRKNLSGSYVAEVVAVYVADLHEGGALKLVLCGADGALAEVYPNMVKVAA